MLSRDKLHEAEPHAIFGELKDSRYLTPAERRASMLAMLQSNPCPDSPVWVFAYGSLIWNPAIHFVERAVGFLPNWRRAFCMKITAGRGTEQKPGRMLSLIPGDGVDGVVYRLSPDNLEHELSLLWKREMCTDGYCPTWQLVTLRNGETVNSLVFVVRTDDGCFDQNHDVCHTAKHISVASGPLGPNAEYVEKLKRALDAEKITDPYVDEIVAALEDATL